MLCSCVFVGVSKSSELMASPHPMPPMRGSRSLEHLTKLSHVRTSPKWSFRGKSPVERRTDTPGPGSYTHSIEKVKPGAPQGFGFGSTPRDPQRPQSAPGPGAYSPPSLGKSSPRTGFGSSTRLSAKSARDAHPGPGAYEHSPRMGVEGPKFSAGARREGPVVHTNPGPGHYEPGSPRGEISSHSTSITKRSPKWGFGSSPREVRPSTVTPGPGAYVAEVAHLKVKKAATPAFTIGTRREKPGSLDTPGPGAYVGHTSTFGY